MNQRGSSDCGRRHCATGVFASISSEGAKFENRLHTPTTPLSKLAYTTRLADSLTGTAQGGQADRHGGSYAVTSKDSLKIEVIIINSI